MSILTGKEAVSLVSKVAATLYAGERSIDQAVAKATEIVRASEQAVLKENPPAGKKLLVESRGKKK